MYGKKDPNFISFFFRQESNESSSVSEEEDLEEDDPECDDEDEDEEHEIPTLPTFHHMRSRRINLDNLKLPETCTLGSCVNTIQLRLLLRPLFRQLLLRPSPLADIILAGCCG